MRKSLKHKRDSQEFERKKAQILQLEHLAKENYLDLFYYDESHFGLVPCVPYAWQSKTNPILVASSKGAYVNVAAFVSGKNQFVFSAHEKTINSQKLVAIFDQFAQQTTKKTVVVLDNAPIHRSKFFQSQIKRWQEEHDLFLFFLPAYSPELNKIEMLWRKIKYYWLDFSAFFSFQSLKDKLGFILNNIGIKFNIHFG